MECQGYSLARLDEAKRFGYGNAGLRYLGNLRVGLRGLIVTAPRGRMGVEKVMFWYFLYITCGLRSGPPIPSRNTMWFRAAG
jgi:hypothetical protein